MVFILKIVILALNVVYFFLKLLPTQNKIVFISRQSNKINLDFLLLGKELEKSHKVIYLCRTLDGGVHSKITTRISYGFHMLKQMYHLATSKVCVLDSYCPTISILKHKKQLHVIQIWHSIGTFKRFGYTAINKKEGSNARLAKVMKMHQNYDVICASSDAYKQHLADGFHVEINKIKTLTLPHIDLLNDKDYEKKTKDKIYNQYPILKKKKNIIYAPTFRTDESQFSSHLNKLIDSFPFTEYNLVVKLHPLSKVRVEHPEVIVDRLFSTFDMLFIADKLISDYSCVIYEAGIRNIPLYFYVYDLNEYILNRGIAIDMKELPGYQETEASKLIKTLSLPYDMAYLKKFIKKYVENSHDCTKKMVSVIENYMK